MNVYCIYFPNGKRYVGVDSRPDRRIRDHSRCSSMSRKDGRRPQLVDVAINKHGWKNCQWRYLATNCSNEDGWALESFFIVTMRLKEDRWGYNRADGGSHGATGVAHTPERIAKINATRLKNGTYVPHHLHTPEMRARSLAVRKQRNNYKGPPDWVYDALTANKTSFKKGDIPWNKGVSYPSKNKGRIGLPAGPNGEMRFFRAEQLI